jgi:phosphohistidine phosphatase
MKLYIVRHAIADPHGSPGAKDEDRALTEEGIRKMHLAAAGLRRLDLIPDLILSSPLLRARQTAEILIEEFGKGMELKILPALAPSGMRRDLYASIASHGKNLNSLMLVGHQPSLGELAGEIISGAGDCFIDFKKGGVCAIEITRFGNPPSGSLISLVTPSILRSIAGCGAADL